MSLLDRLRTRIVRALGGTPPSWRRLDDIDLASRLLATDHYLRFEKPEVLTLDGIRSALVVAPHPDDETVGVGGTMLRLAAAGARITIVAATDGGQRRDDMSVEESARARMDELRQVAATIGATVIELGISNAQPEPGVEHVESLAAAIAAAAPDAIFAPWVLDRPPKHRLVVHLLALALRRWGANAALWGYQVHNALPANGLVDITDVADEKRRLLGLFASQNDRYRRYDHVAMGLAAWNARLLPYGGGEAGERFVEVFHVQSAEAYASDVERTYLPDLARTYGRPALAAAAAALHEAATGHRPGA